MSFKHTGLDLVMFEMPVMRKKNKAQLIKQYAFSYVSTPILLPFFCTRKKACFQGRETFPRWVMIILTFHFPMKMT